MKKELKRINATQDFLLSEMVFLASQQLSILCTYLQKHTPYGKEYKEAYAQYNKTRREFEKLVDKLQDTVQLRNDLLTKGE